MGRRWFHQKDGASGQRGDISLKSTSDGGFTLVELLIVLVILPIIVGAIAFALVSIFSLQNGTANRLANSGDAQIIASTYEKDVQSAAQITTGATPSTPARCGTGGTQLLGLDWTLNSQPIVVTYAEVGSSSPYLLVRYFCAAGIVKSTSTVSYNFPGAQLPVLTCPSDCSSTWASTLGASAVSWTINETNKNSSTGSFLYTLVATPRLYSSIPPTVKPGPPLYPLSLLSTDCSSGPVLNMTGASKLTATVGGTPSGTPLPIRIQASCADAITLIPGQTLSGQVGGIITSDTNTTVPGSDSYCVLENKNGNTCDPTQVGPPETYQAAGADPLAALTAPTNPVLPNTCHVNQACPLGEEFSASPTLSGAFGTTGDTYIFDSPVSITNNASVTFAGGTYWFKGGLNMAQSSVTFGEGTYIFGSPGATCSSQDCLTKSNGGSMSTGPSGALFYVEAGSVSVSGSSQVSILGESDATNYALYGGVAIWDSSKATGTNITISNGAAAGSAYGGIYCPNGEVILSGSGNLSMPFVEASTASLTGSGALSIG